MKQQRLCVYVSDIVVITGKSDRMCRRMLNSLKEAYGKEKYQSVSYTELAEYLGLCPEMVLKSINNIPIGGNDAA